MFDGHCGYLCRIADTNGPDFNHLSCDQVSQGIIPAINQAQRTQRVIEREGQNLYFVSPQLAVLEQALIGIAHSPVPKPD
ncbi:hypothetical protein [Bradyrhizobium liaoningense]